MRTFSFSTIFLTLLIAAPFSASAAWYDSTYDYCIEMTMTAGGNSGGVGTTTTGEFVLWVEPTDISSTSAKTVLMYYGNSGASDQSDEAGVHC